MCTGRMAIESDRNDHSVGGAGTARRRYTCIATTFQLRLRSARWIRLGEDVLLRLDASANGESSRRTVGLDIHLVVSLGRR